MRHSVLNCGRHDYHGPWNRIRQPVAFLPFSLTRCGFGGTSTASSRLTCAGISTVPPGGRSTTAGTSRARCSSTSTHGSPAAPARTDSIRCRIPRCSRKACPLLGIGDDSTVVAYDDAGGVIAARLVWMLRALGKRRPCLTAESPHGGPARDESSTSFTSEIYRWRVARGTPGAGRGPRQVGRGDRRRAQRGPLRRQPSAPHGPSGRAHPRGRERTLPGRTSISAGACAPFRMCARHSRGQGSETVPPLSPTADRASRRATTC